MGDWKATFLQATTNEVRKWLKMWVLSQQGRIACEWSYGTNDIFSNMQTGSLIFLEKTLFLKFFLENFNISENNVISVKRFWFHIIFFLIIKIWPLILMMSVTSVVGPSVNTLMAQLIFAFRTQFLQFVWISSNKIHSKINIFHTLN
jgi:hypothetical protein